MQTPSLPTNLDAEMAVIGSCPDTTGVYEEIGNRVRFVRKARKMTQAGLAKRIGITRVSIANIEAGRQQTPVDRIYAIAVVLNCDIDVLMPPILRHNPFDVSVI